MEHDQEASCCVEPPLISFHSPSRCPLHTLIICQLISCRIIFLQYVCGIYNRSPYFISAVSQVSRHHPLSLVYRVGFKIMLRFLCWESLV